MTGFGPTHLRPPNLLVVCSSLDLVTPFSATPAWWQLLKALYEVGATLHVTTYHGETPATPWWTAHSNPARVAGAAYQATRGALSPLADRFLPSRRSGRESQLDAAIRHLAHAVVAPRWTRHLSSILASDETIDAVILVSVPPNQLRGVARELRSAFDRPILFYDGDVPASLPSHHGFASGFRIHDGADLAEFDAVLSNSEGAHDELRALGARSVHTLHYAADPQLYSPVAVTEDIDVFFYGHSMEYRDTWLDAMIGRPAAALEGCRFAIRGRGLDGINGHGRVEQLPYLSFSRLREYISRSRINLAVTREAHATVHSSSTMRPFELAMMGACIVSNPCAGLETWFEPGREIVVVASADEAIDRYRWLLAHDSERRALGAAARRRALADHTYAHRASELIAIIDEYR
jgi:glycosyltransferase involved in cell wall biosynthesis